MGRARRKVIRCNEYPSLNLTYWHTFHLDAIERKRPKTLVLQPVNGGRTICIVTCYNVQANACVTTSTYSNKHGALHFESIFEVKAHMTSEQKVRYALNRHSIIFALLVSGDCNVPKYEDVALPHANKCPIMCFDQNPILEFPLVLRSD